MATEMSPTHGQLDVKSALKHAESLIGRSTLYQLIAEGKIRSHVLKTRKDNIRGRRVIDLASLDAFLCGTPST